MSSTVLATLPPTAYKNVELRGGDRIAFATLAIRSDMMQYGFDVVVSGMPRSFSGC